MRRQSETVTVTTLLSIIKVALNVFMDGAAIRLTKRASAPCVF